MPGVGKKPKGDPGTWEIQSVIISKDKFTKAQAKAWIKANDKFVDNGVDETGDSYRFRQSDPQWFETFRTISLTDGVTAALGKIKAAKTSTSVIRMPSVALAIQPADVHDPAETEVDGKKWHWEHVATAETYHGYQRDGTVESFMLSAAIFQRMIANLHAHPSYRAGENGGPGTADVIPWDFSHASEQDPTRGDLPVTGAPAQGWTSDLEVRTGADGRAQLWAYTRWLEPAATYVAEGKYRSASISCGWDAIDPVSGAHIGEVLFSIALTNQPFIEGMESLAASRYFGKADTADEALRYLRELFNLGPLDGFDAIQRNLDLLGEMVRSGQAPVGVELSDIVGSIRGILGLATLIPAAEVIGTAKTTINAFLAESAMDEGIPAAGMVPPASTATPASYGLHKGGSNMELLKTLAEVLRVRENDEAVVSAARDLAALRTGTQKALRCERELTADLTSAAEVATKSADGLKALLDALGAKDLASATGRIVALLKDAEDLAKIRPEVEAMRKVQAEREAAQQAADVSEAIAAHHLPEATTAALTLLRKNDPASFAASFPKTAQTSPDIANLERVITAQPAAAPALLAGGAVDLSAYPGPTPSARAMAYVRANLDKNNSFTHEQTFLAAMKVLKTPGCVTDRAGN